MWYYTWSLYKEETEEEKYNGAKDEWKKRKQSYSAVSQGRDQLLCRLKALFPNSHFFQEYLIMIVERKKKKKKNSKIKISKQQEQKNNTCNGTNWSRRGQNKGWKIKSILIKYSHDILNWLKFCW